MPPKARSCVACRLRRVGCKREPADDETAECANCTKRALRCVVAVEATRKRKHVNKRLESARALAETDPSKPVSLREIEATFDAPESSTQASDKASTSKAGLEQQLSIVEDYLPSTELAEQLTSHLVASYLYYHLTQSTCDRPFLMVPVVIWSDFQARFEACDRRVSRMSEDDQQICQIISGIAACISDHALLFRASPHLPDPTRMEEPSRASSMSRAYGHARQPVLDALTKRAQRFCDGAGTWRRASFVNVVKLTLLYPLICRAGARSGEGRLYLVTSIEQLRQLLPMETYPLRTELLGLTLLTVLFDALSAVECKQNVILSDQEVKLFLGRDYQRLSTWPSVRATQSLIFDTDPDSDPKQRWLLVMIALTHAILNIRFFVFHRNNTQSSEIDVPLEQLNDSLCAHEDVLTASLKSASGSAEFTRRHYQVHFGGILAICLILRSYVAQLLSDSLAQAVFLGPDRTQLQDKLRLRMQHVLLELLRHQTTEARVDSLVFGAGVGWSLTAFGHLAHSVVGWDISDTFPASDKLMILERLIESTNKLSWSVVVDDILEVLVASRDALQDKSSFQNLTNAFIESEPVTIPIEPDFTLNPGNTADWSFPNMDVEPLQDLFLELQAVV